MSEKITKMKLLSKAQYPLKNGIDELSEEQVPNIGLKERKEIYGDVAEFKVDMEYIIGMYEDNEMFQSELHAHNYTSENIEKIVGYTITLLSFDARSSEEHSHNRKTPQFYADVNYLDMLDLLVNSEAFMEALYSCFEEGTKRTREENYNDAMKWLDYFLAGVKNNFFRLRRGKNIDGSNQKQTVALIRVEKRFSAAFIDHLQLNVFPLVLTKPVETISASSHKSMYMKQRSVAQTSSNAFNLINKLNANQWEVVSVPNNFGIFALDYFRCKEEVKLGHDLDETSRVEKKKVTDFMSRFELIKDIPFYFQHTYDSRGRGYSDENAFGKMGEEPVRNMFRPTYENFKDRTINDGNREIIRRNIYIALANDCVPDGDKKQLDERVALGIKALYRFDELKLFDFENYGALKMHSDAMKDLNNNIYPKGMIRKDATVQSFQIQAALLRSKDVAKICNLANGNVRADAYQIFADLLNPMLKAYIAKFENERKFKLLTRGDVKHPFMTKGYGKSFIVDDIVESLDPTFTVDKLYMLSKDELSKIKELQISTDNWQSLIHFIKILGIKVEKSMEINVAEDLLGIVNEAIYSIAPEAMDAMQKIIDINKDLKQESYSWTLADGFIANVLTKKESSFVLSIPSGKISEERVAVTMKNKEYVATKHYKGLAANMIHSFDGMIAREIAKRMGDKFISIIHDEFACAYEDAELLDTIYRNILCDLMKGDFLNDALQSLLNSADYSKKVTIESSNDLKCDDIIKSLHTLS